MNSDVVKQSNIDFVRQKSRTAIYMVQSSRFAQRLAKILIIGLFLSMIAMAFLPWQQSSRGTGRVVAYVPQERQQTIQATAKGIVIRIGDGLVEGSKVNKGDFILEIQPFAANKVQQLDAQWSELKTKLATAQAKAGAYGENIRDFTDVQDFAVQFAEQMVEAAEAKLESKQKLVRAYVAKELQARLNLERFESLYESGVKPEKEVEKLKKEWEVADSELNSIKQEVAGLKKEVSAKQAQVEEKRLIAQTKIDYAVAMHQDALGSAASVRKEMGELNVKRDELKRLIVRAPRDGTIFRMPVYELGQSVKEGDTILTLVPETSQKAVELLVNGNDMPLVQVGQDVRLQFEGWPAVQFPGWPSVAVGTFGGEVVTVDATDNGMGEFRVLVLPDESGWPKDRYLRQGVRANGWIMMRRVSLGYEFWRQLNGFPIILSDKVPKKSAKPPKIPK